MCAKRVALMTTIAPGLAVLQASAMVGLAPVSIVWAMSTVHRPRRLSVRTLFAVRAKPTASVIASLDHCDLSVMLLVRPLDRVGVPWGPLSAWLLRLRFVAQVTINAVVVKVTESA